LMTANAITMASLRLPAVILRTLIVALPAADCALRRYEPIVPPEIWFRTNTSPAAIVELLKTNETVVLALSVALFSVICPHGRSSVTAVDLLVSWVIVPPAPVEYPTPKAELLVLIAPDAWIPPTTVSFSDVVFVPMLTFPEASTWNGVVSGLTESSTINEIPVPCWVTRRAVLGELTLITKPPVIVSPVF